MQMLCMQLVSSIDPSDFGDHVVLTPHDAEYEYLTGHRPQTNRILDVRETAAKLNMVILLKGSTTIISHPDGRCLLVNNGDQRLATAGTVSYTHLTLPTTLNV